MTEYFTTKELIEFMTAQPDDRKLNFDNNIVKNDEDCGCLLVQFARAKLFGGKIDCGYNHAHNGVNKLRAINEYEVFKFIKFGCDLSPKIKNYGDYRELLTERFPEFTKL